MSVQLFQHHVTEPCFISRHKKTCRSRSHFLISFSRGPAAVAGVIMVVKGLADFAHTAGFISDLLRGTDISDHIRVGVDLRFTLDGEGVSDFNRAIQRPFPDDGVCAARCQGDRQGMRRAVVPDLSTVAVAGDMLTFRCLPVLASRRYSSPDTLARCSAHRPQTAP
ncbi:Uncharacterised protein [Citrobacter koseri]|nr:Uncharacterised protein [Citrobacter koseri]